LGATSSIVRDTEGSRTRSDGGGSKHHDNRAIGVGGNRTAASVVLNKSLALTPKTAMLVMLKAELPELVRVTV